MSSCQPGFDITFLSRNITVSIEAVDINHCICEPIRERSIVDVGGILKEKAYKQSIE